jgi:hypothetical protein
MKRVCLPEMLDALPPDHPDAQHSRRDLRIINVIMRNRGWLVSSVKASVRPGERILEIGAGTGELAMALQAEGLPVDGLDRCPRPPGWPEGSAWHQGDLRTFGGYASYPVILANLILHQFSDGDLAGIGAVLRRDARVVIACEPERWRFTQAAMAIIAPLFGASLVTLHDAHVSMAAGFRGSELASALGMDGAGWGFARNKARVGMNRVILSRAQ